MTDTARRWAEVKASLKAGDLEKAENKVDAIMKATRDIQDFILHRNADKQEEFWKECELFKEDLKKLKDALTGKNAEQAKSHAALVAKSCTRCHAQFK